MKKLTLQILLLTTSIYSIAGDHQITVNREISWSSVLDAIGFANASLSTGLKALSDHIIKKYLDQKPILIIESRSEETITCTVNFFSTNPQTSNETKKTVLTAEYNIKDQIMRFKDPLEEKGISCSIAFREDPSKDTLNASINFTFEPKARLFFDNIEKKMAQVNR